MLRRIRNCYRQCYAFCLNQRVDFPLCQKKLYAELGLNVYGDGNAAKDERPPIRAGGSGHVGPREEAPSQKGRHLPRAFAAQTEVPIIEHRVPVLPVEACRIEGLRRGLLVQWAFVRLSALDRLRHVRFREFKERLAGVVQLGDAGGVLRS